MGQRLKRTAPHPAASSTHAGSVAPAPPRTLAFSSGWMAAGALVLIALAGVFAYANTLHAPFVFDDESSIVNNPFIRGAHDLNGVAMLWHWGPTRFVTNLSFAANYALGGMQVTGYHVVNLAVHLCTAAVVFWLALLLQRTPAVSAMRQPLRAASVGRIPLPVALAAFAALLFVSHPIQTQAVAYVSQRAASLAAFFYLLALALYVEAALQRRRVPPSLLRRSLLLAGCGVAFLLALFTKENTATLPVIILMTEWFFFPSTGARAPAVRTALVLCAAVGVVAGGLLAYLVGGVARIGGLLATGAYLSRGKYLLTEINVVRTYVRLLFLPVGQNLDYAYPIASGFEASTLLSALLLLGLVLLAVRVFRSRRLIAYGICFFFVTLLVESSVIPLPDVIFEHRLYLPSFGFVLAVSAAVFAVLDRITAAAGARQAPVARRWRYATTAALVCVVVAASMATRARNALWADPISLWTDVARKSPGKARAHHNLGRTYAQAGRLREAVEQYRQALALDQSLVKGHNNLGNAYQQLGQLGAAEVEYRLALALDPRFVNAYSNLGFLYQQMGRLDDADAVLQQAVAIEPYNGEVQRALGKLYYRRRDWPHAEEHYRLALSGVPDSADTHNELGAVYYAQGKLDDAAAEYRRAAELQPDLADAYNNLGNVLLLKGSSREAEAAYRHALQLAPREVDTLLNLGQVYRVMGRWREAETMYREVVKLQPASVEAYSALAVVYQQLGRPEAAAAALERARALGAGRGG